MKEKMCGKILSFFIEMPLQAEVLRKQSGVTSSCHSPLPVKAF